MSHRGGRSSESWPAQGIVRTSAMENPIHPDDMAFVHGPGRPMQADRYGMAIPNAFPSSNPYMTNSWSSLHNVPFDPREYHPSQKASTTDAFLARPSHRVEGNPSFVDPRSVSGGPQFDTMGPAIAPSSTRTSLDRESRLRSSPDHYLWEDGMSLPGSDFQSDRPPSTPYSGPWTAGKGPSQRRPSNRDEFDGPHQFLDKLAANVSINQERDLPHLPTNLVVAEQDQILAEVNDRLSQCAYDFVAKYQFPIPLEPDKRPVKAPADREWTEWVFLLKRLATKRRVPARVLYNGQIKQLVTVLENSLEMRHAAKHQSRPLKDDRNVLQLISAGLQVAKILKDVDALKFLDGLYVQTERLIQTRRNAAGYMS